MSPAPEPRRARRDKRQAASARQPARTRQASRPVPGCDLSPLFRKIAPACYDHIGGVVGEELFRHLLSQKWLSADPRTGAVGITPLGWKELKEFGVDTELLRTTKRKPVNACVERHGGKLYPHTGSLLGMLLRDHLLELGWLEDEDGKSYSLTSRGISALLALGIDLTRVPGAATL